MVRFTPAEFRRAPPARRQRGVVIADDGSKMFSAGTPSARPTAEMLRDAVHRNYAPRSLTSWVCGDPAPGRSALDQLRS